MRKAQDHLLNDTEPLDRQMAENHSRMSFYPHWVALHWKLKQRTLADFHFHCPDHVTQDPIEGLPDRGEPV